jgi:UDP-N-acetylmuramate--alanine ligase
MASFKGVQRRFNIHVNTQKTVYIDDYAHHPDEIATSIDSVRRLYPDRRLIGVFQPHLYTRTRDFADGFARVLRTLDECILLPVYPAREEPIPGVNSEMLADKIRARVVEKADLVSELKKRVQESPRPVVVMTIGAGDIDRLVPEIAAGLR